MDDRSPHTEEDRAPQPFPTPAFIIVLMLGGFVYWGIVYLATRAIISLMGGQ